MTTRRPRVYLDTNILLDLYYNRRPDTISLINRGINNDWDITSSFFALMEMIDVDQELVWAQRRLVEDHQQLNTVIAGRHQRDLPSDALEGIRQRIRSFTDTSYPQITLYDFAETGVLERAMGLCASTNMTAPDAIHVQMALEIGVDLLITLDQHVQREAREWVPTSAPNSAISTLREMGFDISDP